MKEIIMRQYTVRSHKINWNDFLLQGVVQLVKSHKMYDIKMLQIIVIYNNINKIRPIQKYKIIVSHNITHKEQIIVFNLLPVFKMYFP